MYSSPSFTVNTGAVLSSIIAEPSVVAVISVPALPAKSLYPFIVNSILPSSISSVIVTSAAYLYHVWPLFSPSSLCIISAGTPSIVNVGSTDNFSSNIAYTQILEPTFAYSWLAPFSVLFCIFTNVDTGAFVSYTNVYSSDSFPAISLKIIVFSSFSFKYCLMFW